MEAFNNFINWLFTTRMGVIALMLGGVLVFLVVAFLLEKPMRKQFYNHEKSPDDWDLFDMDDE